MGVGICGMMLAVKPGVLEKCLSHCNLGPHKSHKQVILTGMHFILGNVVTYGSYHKVGVNQM